MASKSTNHVTSVASFDTAHWFSGVQKFVYSPSTALSDEYRSNVCQVGLLYARLSLTIKSKKKIITSKIDFISHGPYLR